MASAVFSLRQSILGLSRIEQKRLYLLFMPWIEAMRSALKPP